MSAIWSSQTRTLPSFYSPTSFDRHSRTNLPTHLSPITPSDTLLTTTMTLEHEQPVTSTPTPESEQEDEANWLHAAAATALASANETLPSQSSPTSDFLQPLDPIQSSPLNTPFPPTIPTSSPWSTTRPSYIRLNSPPPLSLAPSQQQPPPAPILATTAPPTTTTTTTPQPNPLAFPSYSQSPPYPPSSPILTSPTTTATTSTPLSPPHPTRSLVLRNLPPGLDDAHIRATLEAFGPLRELGAQLRARGGRGAVKATYYDLRHAKRCIHTLNGITRWGRRLEARFCSGADNCVGVSGNQGTLVVFNLDAATSAEDVRRVFGVYGDVKEIRETPNKRHHKFVEFFDVRDAERAMRGLNKTEIGGKRIKIEISRPGGRVVGKERGECCVGSCGIAGHGIGGSTAKSCGMCGRTGFQGGDKVNVKFALDIEKVRMGEDKRTALMIRNIPNKYNQKMLVATLEEHHRGRFDFLYLPIDFKNKCNVGYAFINFMDAKYIPAFYEEFHGKKWGRFNSEKICCITYARIQGKGNLIAHFQNSSLMNEDPKCQPVVFDHLGRREEFPVGSHVRTRRGPSVREARSLENSPHCSPRTHHHYHHHHHTFRRV